MCCVIPNSSTPGVTSTTLSFTEQEIKDRIKSSPELFSPNVITRCLFQQRILPNVCYLGGPAEIVYWESFKKFFDNYNIPYPVLVPRDFALLLTAKVQKLIKKLNLSSIDLFDDKNKIENKVLAVETDESKNFKREIEILCVLAHQWMNTKMKLRKQWKLQ